MPRMCMSELKRPAWLKRIMDRPDALGQLGTLIADKSRIRQVLTNQIAVMEAAQDELMEKDRIRRRASRPYWDKDDSRGIVY